MKAVVVFSLLALASAAAAQTTTAPALPAPGRDTPIGTCRLFDETAANIGVDGALKFYQCTSNAQRRYARSECEFFVALNRLVRSVKIRISEDAADHARRTLGDSDDYTEVKVDAEGDTATIARTGQKPLPLARVNDQWFFSMPDWFEQQTADDLQTTRLYYESAADLFDALREQVDAGKIKTAGDLDEQLQKIAATR